MKRYQIWDKKSQVITPAGEILTAEEWMNRYPMSKLDEIDLVIGGGLINGSFCTEYTTFVDIYERSGFDSSGYETREEVVDAIEEFEKAREQAAKEASEETYVTAEERIAAALEAQVMMMMPDVE